MIDKLKTGGFQANPARSGMVGVIGLWRNGEPIHESAERPLIQFAQGQPGKVALPGFFKNFLFMPVTREMSAGQRTLLYNWLDAGAKPVAAAAVAAP